MKTIVSIGLLALIIPMGVIQSRRGVSQDRVDGQMDTEEQVDRMAGAGWRKTRAGRKTAQGIIAATGFADTVQPASASALEGIKTKASLKFDGNGEFTPAELNMLAAVNEHSNLDLEQVPARSLGRSHKAKPPEAEAMLQARTRTQVHPAGDFALGRLSITNESKTAELREASDYSQHTSGCAAYGLGFDIPVCEGDKDVCGGWMIAKDSGLRIGVEVKEMQQVPKARYKFCGDSTSEKGSAHKTVYDDKAELDRMLNTHGFLRYLARRGCSQRPETEFYKVSEEVLVHKDLVAVDCAFQTAALTESALATCCEKNQVELDKLFPGKGFKAPTKGCSSAAMADGVKCAIKYQHVQCRLDTQAMARHCCPPNTKCK